MRIYITGIQGMLGSALAYIHSADSKDIVAGCDISAEDSLFSRIDITDKNSLSRDIQRFKPDRIYHCAAMLGVKNTEDHPEQCVQFNTEGTRNVAEIARKLGAELVFLSSSEVYGDPASTTPLSEIAPLLGSNVYAQSKIDGEVIVLQPSSAKVVVCRMFNCFGPRQVAQFFVPKSVKRAVAGHAITLYGNEDNLRSYLFSYDAAMHIKAVADNAPTGSVVNVASDEKLTLGEMARLILSVSASSSDIEIVTDVYEDRALSRDIPNRVADTTLLKTYSKHVGSKTEQGLRFVVSQLDTLADDWSYERF